MIRVSGQSKSRPVKAAGAEVRAQERNQKLHAAVAKRTFRSLNVQNTSCLDHFWKFRCPKIARNAHSQLKMLKKLTVSEHFLKFRCGKIARRCGETYIWTSKCTKHLMLGPLLEVLMSKNCTLLWRNAHLQLKMLKNWRSRGTFWSSDVENLYAAVAKRTFASQNVKKLRVSEHFLKFRCRKISQLPSSSVNQSVR